MSSFPSPLTFAVLFIVSLGISVLWHGIRAEKLAGIAQTFFLLSVILMAVWGLTTLISFVDYRP